MQKDKKNEICSDLSNDLFSQVDIDLVSEKIEKNLPALYADKAYGEIDDKLMDINVKLSASFDNTQKKLFREYLDTLGEANIFQNCLAYYLGIKAGLDMSELK